VRELQAAGGTPLTRPSRTGLLAAVALLVLATDVVTKLLVVATLADREVELFGGLVTLRESRNPGAAFGIAGGMTIVFTAVAVVVALVIARTARRLRSRGWAVALGLVMGGALGNLVDRLFRDPGPLRGAVVDFIDLPYWPSFNVADSAIVCGGLLALLLSSRGVEPGDTEP
jgi:lipoprotein signal peptidase